MKKLLRNAFIATLTAASVAGMTGCSSTVIKFGLKDNTLKIGLSGPLTGDYAVYGSAAANSAAMAVAEINANGGLNGLKFSFEALDDQADPVAGSNNYSQLKQKGMQVSLGSVTSDSCLALYQEAKKDGMFVICGSATNDKVPGEGMYQVCFNDGAQGALAVDYIQKNCQGMTIGVLYNSGNAYSKGLYDYFKDTYQGDYVAAEFTDTEVSFTTQIAKLKDCDFIFLPIYYTPAAKFIENGKNTIKKDAIYFGCDGLDGIDTVIDVTAYSQKISMLSHFDPNSNNTKTRDFCANYKSYFEAETLNQFGAGTYDCVYVIYNCLKNSGKTITADMTPAELNAILKAEMQKITYSGVTGNMTWGSKYTVTKDAQRYVLN